METKEKSRTKAPANQRPGKKPQVSAGKAPARPRQKQPEAPVKGDYEVYIPDEETQRVRHGAPEDQINPARSSGKAAPPRFAATAKASAKRAPASREGQYRPYQKANRQNKARKRKAFRENISKFFSYQNPLVRKFYKEDPAVFGEDARACLLYTS